MKLKVELMWWDGLVEDDAPGPPEPDYELVDADTGQSLSDREFGTYEELEAHIAARYPGCERWVPPPAPPEKAAGLARVLELLESGTELDRVVVRRLLIGQLYQFGYPDETVALIRVALARLA
jgi:hypothetical protein